MRAISAPALESEARALGAGRRLLAACVARGGHGPSEALIRALEALPPEVAAQVELCRIDADQDAAALDARRVFKVPELLLLGADGRVVERTEGEMTDAQVAELVTYVLDAMLPAD